MELGKGSPDCPASDGLLGVDEYYGFMDLPMFDGGKNDNEGIVIDAEDRIGTSHVAYDNFNNVVCVTAYLYGSYMDCNPTIGITHDE
jgi:hypothetical protein